MTLHDNNNNVCDTHDIEGVSIHMGFQDYAAQHNIELDENDNAQYVRVSQMYISKNTREGYQSCMKILLLFLDDKNPECVLDYAKRALQDSFPSGATVKHNNKAVISRALQLIKSANCTFQPINFVAVTDNVFVDFFFRDGKKKHIWKKLSNQKWLWILHIRFQGSIPLVPGFCASSFRSRFDKILQGFATSPF